MTAPSYRTWLTWGEGHGSLHSTDRPPLPVSALREFGGPGDTWSPEELLVGAIESCVVATFMALARHASLKVARCSSTAVGTIGPTEGNWGITNVDVSLHIAVTREVDRPRAVAIAADAHRKSVVANSFRWPLQVDAVVGVEPSGG